jgi:hypothetical protein
MLIDSGYFCAGVVFKFSVVTKAAPILHYMVGWPRSKIIAYCNKKGWKYQESSE